MTSADVNCFLEEKQCTYNGEIYSVRDNGAVFRHSKAGKRVRPNDNKWTFGKENKNNPYLHISNVRVHRIVATAFHGNPPDANYVVDHIDTNCRNNRPDNLRWLTRLENTLKNPFTRKKIEYLCGSIEAFLENPSMLNNLDISQNFAWMRTVTQEEAQNCKNRMNLWLNKPSKKNNNRKTNMPKNGFGKSIYKPLKKWEVFGREPGLDLAKTPRCGQYMWNAGVYFPQCPENFWDDPLLEYYKNLRLNEIFSFSENPEICPKLTLVKKTYIEETTSILVLAKSDNEKLTIAGIQIDKKSGFFIHFYLGSFMNECEADDYLSILKEKKDLWGQSLTMSYKKRL